jgi:hypothetical protein
MAKRPSNITNQTRNQYLAVGTAVPPAFEPENVGINIQHHEINNARTLFRVKHITVTADAESVNLGLPDILAHDIPYFEKCDGEPPV